MHSVVPLGDDPNCHGVENTDLEHSKGDMDSVRESKLKLILELPTHDLASLLLLVRLGIVKLDDRAQTADCVVQLLSSLPEGLKYLMEQSQFSNLMVKSDSSSSVPAVIPSSGAPLLQHVPVMPDPATTYGNTTNGCSGGDPGGINSCWATSCQEGFPPPPFHPPHGRLPCISSMTAVVVSGGHSTTATNR